MVHVIPLARPLRECRWPGCHVEPIERQIPLCDRHFEYIGQRFMDERSIFGPAALAERKAQREREAAEWKAAHGDPEETRDDWSRRRSVVYYVRTGDHVKIGYTIHLRERISALRVERDALLAVEPGWREREAERHAQFDAERQGRRENFNPSRRLLAHVNAVRAKHGEPWDFARRRVNAAGPEPIEPVRHSK